MEYENKAYINDLPNLRCHSHSLSSCMLLKLRIDGESMQELTTYLAHYKPEVDEIQNKTDRIKRQ